MVGLLHGFIHDRHQVIDIRKGSGQNVQLFLFMNGFYVQLVKFCRFANVFKMQLELCRFEVERFISRIQSFNVHRDTWTVESIADSYIVVYHSEYDNHLRYLSLL